MKLILLTLVLFFTTYAFSQDNIDYDIVDGSFEMIIELDSTKSQSEIYKAGRNLIIKYFKDAKEVIQLDDAESGKLFARGNTVVTYQSILGNDNVIVLFDMDFQAKDARYRIFCDNLILQFQNDGYAAIKQNWLVYQSYKQNKTRERIIQATKDDITAIMALLASDMQNSLENKSSW